MVEMRKAGFAISDIAQKAGMRPETVASRFRTWGVQPEFPVVPKPRISESIYEVIRRLYWDEGLTIEEIAEIRGCHATTIRHHMVQGGIPRRNNSEGQKIAWQKGRQPPGPRGFILNRLQKVEQEKNNKNNNDNSADSVH